MRDFTVQKYKVLINTLKKEQYRFFTVKDALCNREIDQGNKVAVIRHDIDTRYDSPIALQMARFEVSNNISATYYFRTIPDVFDESVIRDIYEMGHEIGYHYEVLSLTRGNLEKAIDLFQKDLSRLRSICPIHTICQHGGTLGPYSSTSFFGLVKTSLALLRGKLDLKYYPSIKLWDKYDFKDYGICGDAYLSFDFSKIKYFSDTGSSWDNHGARIVDDVEEGQNAELKAHSTNDLIALIENRKVEKLSILVHPANWNDPILKWIKWRALQFVRNISKRVIKK